MILLDIPPPPFSDPVSITAGIGFFFIVAAIAVAVFFLLKRSVHVGIRTAITAVLLLVAVAGSIVVSTIAAGSRYKPNRPPINRQNVTTG